VQVVDRGTTDGLTWLVMELVRGHDLSRVLRAEGPLSAVRVVRLLVQVCGSLAEAHGLGIVHRDIKPANLMLTQAADGEEMVKVLDFGLAKLRQGPELNEITARGVVLGTPAYMAPEQIEGRPVDGRTDIYALGAVAYRLLTGKHVFSVQDSTEELLARHLVEPPVAPQLRAPHLDIPEALGAVVLRALEKRPEDRFQSVDELRVALLRALSSEETLPGLDEPPSRPIPLILPEHATRDEVAAYERKLVRQRRAARGLLAAGLFTAMGLSVGAARLLAPSLSAQGEVAINPSPALTPSSRSSAPRPLPPAQVLAAGGELRGRSSQDGGAAVCAAPTAAGLLRWSVEVQPSLEVGAGLDIAWLQGDRATPAARIHGTFLPSTGQTGGGTWSSAAFHPAEGRAPCLKLDGTAPGQGIRWVVRLQSAPEG
jgi:serine/threonine-protein kinase